MTNYRRSNVEVFEENFIYSSRITPNSPWWLTLFFLIDLNVFFVTLITGEISHLSLELPVNNWEINASVALGYICVRCLVVSMSG